ERIIFPSSNQRNKNHNPSRLHIPTHLQTTIPHCRPLRTKRLPQSHRHLTGQRRPQHHHHARPPVPSSTLPNQALRIPNVVVVRQ
ncbi:hypothetical protein U1Q18_024719, partial [Sarracenia purpurea var. burkii]